ncbi:YciI family protein [Shimazuella kribbensis]|uniref:YciI family protein n=1 Tax=Shimazuella kribbensis TaxID=139808 RepID=UPI00048B0CA0|nr:YciI family protein [Shimazuella kribbensis]
MQFMVIGYDGIDPMALSRRLKAREDHISLGDKLVKSGNMLFGVALLKDNKMVGSMVIVDFPTREDLDKWLAIEPYVTGDVWQKIEIKNCQVGPSFISMLGQTEVSLLDK